MKNILFLCMCAFVYVCNVQAEEPRKRHVAVVALMPPAGTQQEYDKALAKATMFATESQNFYRYYDRHGRWDIQITPLVLNSNCSPSPPIWCKPAVKVFLKEMDYWPTNIQLLSRWLHPTHNYAGLGQMPGMYSTIYTNATYRTGAHELGHNWWLNHAEGEENYDTTDVMGYLQIGSNPGLNAANIWRMGFEEDYKTIITSTQQILLAPIELTTDATHPVEDRYVLLRTDNYNDVIISLRKRKGTYYRPVERYNSVDTVYIHEFIPSLSTNLITRIRPGARLRLPGIVIDYVEYLDESARINITYSDAPASLADLVMPEGLPQRENAVGVEPEHSGLWYNPLYNGQGLDVHVKGDRVTVLWYTFNEYSDSRRYYIGSYNRTETDEFEMYTTDRQELIHVGKGKLTFDSGIGVFNFNTTEHGRGSAKLEALVLSENSMNGLWITDIENEGFSFYFLERNNKKTVIGYWYTHGMPGIEKNTSQRWFMLQGEEISDGLYNFTIYEIMGGKWLFFDQAKAEEVGTGNIEVLDNNNMLLRYELEGEFSNLVLFRLIRLF